MALFGTKSRANRAPVQQPLSASAVARMQEDARVRTIAALRVKAQERFDVEGLPRGFKVIR